MNRPIKYIVVHCTDSPNPAQDVAMVRSWQVDPRFNGGSPLLDIAYHFLIRMDGAVEPGRPMESPGAGEPGYNRTGIHIALAGRDNFKPCQFASLESLLRHLHDQFPDAVLYGHREINRGAPKTCPNFDMEWLKARWREWKARGRLV